ncbi:MAG: sulfurtransferase complex subunit TusD [Pseudomonadales bacterium]|nr:sulfurtransferase complex subunit TusD [Pseudomonadales bacterium]
MKFSLAIYGAPCSSQAPDTAYYFAKAALASGHDIYRLFFYMDGVQNASRLATPPQDEQNIPARWSELIKAHNIDAVVCIAAALRRGVLDKSEADRYEKDANNLADGFNLSGLGQLIDAGIESDRLITFGC